MSANVICFPALPDDLTGRTAIGNCGVLKGRRLTLGERVVTGSWKLPDGGRGYHYSRWIEYERVVWFDKLTNSGVSMAGMALIPDHEYTPVMVRQAHQQTFSEFAERKAAA